jgi:hypothetical protein
LTLRPLPLVSSDYARRPFRFSVSVRAIFNLLAGGAAARRDRRALTASLANAQKFFFYMVREPVFRWPAIMLQPGMSLDFRRQWHHVKLSALVWMLTFWPRDEPSGVSLPHVQPDFLRSPRPRGASPQNSVAAEPYFPARAPAQRKTNN